MTYTLGELSLRKTLTDGFPFYSLHWMKRCEQKPTARDQDYTRMSVSMNPGAYALTVILCFPNSTASFLVVSII